MPQRFWCFLSYSYLCRHSPRAGYADITNCVDHVPDKGTPGLTVTRDLRPVLSPSCGAEDSRSRDRFQVGLDRGCPRLQLASSSSAPCARQCGKEKVLHQFTVGTSCSMTEPLDRIGAFLLKRFKAPSTTKVVVSLDEDAPTK